MANHIVKISKSSALVFDSHPSLKLPVQISDSLSVSYTVKPWVIYAAARGAPKSRRMRTYFPPQTRWRNAARRRFILRMTLTRIERRPSRPDFGKTNSITLQGDFAITRNPSAAVTDPTYLGYIRIPRDSILPRANVLTPQGEGVVVASCEIDNVNDMCNRRVSNMDKSSLNIRPPSISFFCIRRVCPAGGRTNIGGGISHTR